MLWMLTVLMLYTPYRIDVSAEIAGNAWGFKPQTLIGLASVESTFKFNPPRYGHGKRWGPPPLGRRWNYCGLMQLRGGGQPMGAPPRVRFPPCEVLIILPELSVWYGAMHLRGWRKRYGMPMALEAYNKGSGCETSDGSFARRVKRHAKIYKKRLPHHVKTWYSCLWKRQKEGVAWKLLTNVRAASVENQSLLTSL